MKQIHWIAMVTIGLALPAQSALHTSGELTALIPQDGVTWYSSSITVSGEASSLTDVNVLLNLTGGYNGDLYGYLVYDGTTAVLLNRIGLTTLNPFGSAGAGMNVTLSDGATDIHTAGDAVLTGMWAPDGRAISPLSSGAAFDSALRQNGGNPLGLYDGKNPNGTWTLYFMDVVGGVEQSTLDSWSLDITAVPEPAHVALGIFGGVLALGGLVRRRLKKD